MHAHRGATAVVPDIYSPAKVQDGWVLLATDLTAGERVQLITEGNVALRSVVEVCTDRFRVDAALPEQVFVYGREVRDFHNVDYDALTTLNLSATQALYRKLQRLEADNAALLARLEALEAVVQGQTPAPER